MIQHITNGYVTISRVEGINSKANALLIAAAQELLAAAEQAILETSDGEPATVWQLELLEAIAKAKGKPLI
jgi:hypothetical protein